MPTLLDVGRALAAAVVAKALVTLSRRAGARAETWTILMVIAVVGVYAVMVSKTESAVCEMPTDGKCKVNLE